MAQDSNHQPLVKPSKYGRICGRRPTRSQIRQTQKGFCIFFFHADISMTERKQPSVFCGKSLKRWVKRAGINKHISWHCGRHGFAMNILNNGANIKTVASLLGHSRLKHTEKHTRSLDKSEAINSLPALKI